MEIDKLLLEGSAGAIRDAYLARHVSAAEAVSFYLARIERLNGGRHSLNAVKSVAGDALDHARNVDAALASGRPLGPLHGIPVLLKDNILVPGLGASAGSGALQSFRPQREATLVARLRRSGAIILGKTNMTDFADYVSDVMPSGFSTAGGWVKNPVSGEPYGRGQGSSVGSAAAVAASLAPIAIGSETQNSIQTPACASSIFGFKPSVGTVSRHGIVPLVPSQDSPGPLTRCMEDAVLVACVLAGPDPADTLTMAHARSLSGFRPRDLRHVRIGVPRRTVVDRPELTSALPVFERALSTLSAAGATIVDPCDLPSAEQIRDVRTSVFPTEFKAAFETFLADHSAPCGIDGLERLIAWYETNAGANPFGHSLLLAAQQTAGFDHGPYQADRRRDIILSRTAGIDAAVQLGVDVLMVPMTSLAKATGKAGAPVLALPIGTDETGVPVGATLIAPMGRDAELLACGSAVVEAIAQRFVPKLD